MARNLKRRSSPEEEEEPLEPEVDSARRSALPSFVRRNLLQASPSQRSKGSRTATLTPTPQEIFQHREPSLLAPGGPGRAGKLPSADESQQTAIDTRSQAEAVLIAQATVPAPKARSTRASRSATIIDNADEGDDSGPEMTTQRNAEAGPSKPAHGRYAQVQETINIEPDSDQFDHQSLFSSSSSIRPRAPASTRKQTIRTCKGAPFVELPYLSLPHLKTFTLPTGIRGPTPLSRNEQIKYSQTPPRSPRASSEDSAATWRVSQRPRSGLFPRWATMPKDDSSDDLGGYGVEVTEDELEWNEEEESSDGIEITRRSTRSKGKGKEVERKRTTRAEAAVSDMRGWRSLDQPFIRPAITLTCPET
jgi:hypothetical protein